MAETILGKASFVPRGVHDSTLTYERLNLVTDADKTMIYVATKNVPSGTALSNTEYWMALICGLQMGEVTTVSADTGASAEIVVDSVTGLPTLNMDIPRGVTGNESIDDTAGSGDTDVVWSAGKTFAEVEEVKNICVQNTLGNITYVIGTISSTGANSTSTSRLRNNNPAYIPCNGHRHIIYSVPENFKIRVHYYSEGQSSAFVSRTDWLTGSGDLICNPTYYYRFIIAKSDDSDITLEELPAGFTIANGLIPDKSLSIDGKAADAKAVGDNLSHYQSWAEGANIYITGVDLNWKSGVISLESGGIITDDTKISSLTFLKVESGDRISVADGYKFIVGLYSSEDYHSFIKVDKELDGNPYTVPYGCYVRFSMADDEDSELTDTNISMNLSTTVVKTKVTEVAYRTINLHDYLWEPGAINIANGKIALVNKNTRLSCASFIKLQKGNVISIEDGYKYSVAMYTSPSEDDFDDMGKRLTTDKYFIVPADCYIRITIANEDDSPVTFDIIDNLVISQCKQGIGDYSDAAYARKNANSYMFKDVRLENCSISGYYQGLGSDYSLFNKTTTAEAYYEAWDNLQQENSEYIAVTEEGYASDGSLLKSYMLSPLIDTDPHYKPENKLAKFIIISGQHGFEKSAPYGLYYFVRDLCENWQQSDLLTYIRNNVQLVILPCANPWGFDNFQYKNYNGVNINRNYDWNFVVYPDETSGEYGGPYAFSEPESRIVRDIVERHNDAFIFIDFHTNGSGVIANWSRVNWHSFTSTMATDAFGQRMYNSAFYHIRNITGHFIHDYAISEKNTLFGYVTTASNENEPTAKEWVEKKKQILSQTFEGFNGFPGRTAFSSEEQKANSELIGNWLGTLCNSYRN